MIVGWNKRAPISRLSNYDKRFDLKSFRRVSHHLSCRGTIFRRGHISKLSLLEKSKRIFKPQSDVNVSPNSILCCPFFILLAYLSFMWQYLRTTQLRQLLNLPSPKSHDIAVWRNNGLRKIKLELGACQLQLSWKMQRVQHPHQVELDQKRIGFQHNLFDVSSMTESTGRIRSQPICTRCDATLWRSRQRSPLSSYPNWSRCTEPPDWFLPHTSQVTKPRSVINEFAVAWDSSFALQSWDTSSTLTKTIQSCRLHQADKATLSDWPNRVGNRWIEWRHDVWGPAQANVKNWWLQVWSCVLPLIGFQS
jgi:hypothetical protein